jgi:hypothetical protein
MFQTWCASVFQRGKPRTGRRSKDYLLKITFTSPNDDDHISKDEYWKKCWPGSEKIHAIRIDKLLEKGDEAFVRYECELKDGARFRNTEYFRIEGKKIKEVEVYFGSSVNKRRV